MRPLIANIVNAIRTSAGSRENSVRQMRALTRSTLIHHRAVRRQAAGAIRQALHEHRATVIASLRATFIGHAAQTRSTGPRPETDANTDATPATALEHTSVWELSPVAPRERDADATYELLQVLGIIQSHPEGICARDVGNALGIDWRRVLGLTRTLVEAGMVEQVKQDFYPVPKAGRR